MVTPTIVVYTDGGSDLNSVFEIVGPNYDDAFASSTELTLIHHGTNLSISLIGTGLTYQGGNTSILTGGHITSMEISDPNGHAIDIDNLSLNGGKLYAAIASGKPEKFYALLHDLTAIGGGGSDDLHGTAGNDALDGKVGDDRLDGGRGADWLDGGVGADMVSYASATQGVHANLADSSHNTHDAAGDTYIAVEDLQGSAFKDKLTGDAHDNVILGQDGNDLLHGGAGPDRLYGGSGADRFTFNRSDCGLGAHQDTIFDWDAHDTIGIDASSFGHGLVAGHALTHAQFHVAKQATGHHAQFYYDAVHHYLGWDSDGTGHVQAVAVFFFVDATALHASDIVVI